ncbi:hypothetical protein SB775_10770 [Peribacillus sp. SIMBA_075]
MNLGVFDLKSFLMSGVGCSLSEQSIKGLVDIKEEDIAGDFYSLVHVF